MKRTIAFFTCALLLDVMGLATNGWSAEKNTALPHLAEFMTNGASASEKEETPQAVPAPAQRRKLSPVQSVLLSEGVAAIYSAIGFIDGGAAILGGLYILSSPLSFNGPPDATGAGMMRTFVGFLGLAAYNFYLDHADVSGGRVFRDNFIGMNAVVLSATVANSLSRDSIPRKKTAGLFFNPTEKTIGLKIPW